MQSKACKSRKATVEDACHDRDRTHPYTPCPDLSMPIPSHLNHSRAPNTKPEPSDPLASQQRTPEHSDSLASSQRIPDPTPFDLHSFASKSIPDVSLASRLRSGEARSRTSLARCVLVCPFSLPIYMFPLRSLTKLDKGQYVPKLSHCQCEAKTTEVEMGR